MRRGKLLLSLLVSTGRHGEAVRWGLLRRRRRHLLCVHLRDTTRLPSLNRSRSLPPCPVAAVAAPVSSHPLLALYRLTGHSLRLSSPGCGTFFLNGSGLTKHSRGSASRFHRLAARGWRTIAFIILEAESSDTIANEIIDLLIDSASSSLACSSRTKIQDQESIDLLIDSISSLLASSSHSFQI
jgi:hypothetical protein